MADSVVNPLTVRDFSKVILTLDNVLVQSEKLSETPSMQDGLDFETETDLRILGCELIQTSGILLKLPQVAMATGQVLFQRFYYSKSFVKHNMEVVAMACVNLASKIEESPRRIRDVINVFHHIKQVRSGRTIQPLILDQNYINIKNQVIKAERRVLKELGFCVHVKHPHKIIVMYLQVLDSANNRRLVQCAWNYMNDSFRTNVFMKYQPETIACACIYLAARQLQVPLPDSPPWYYLFEVEEDEIRDICILLLNLYSRPKPNCDELEKIVEKAKKIQVEAKLKAKGLTSEYGTPNSTSRQNSPKNVSPNPSILPGMRKVKLEEDHHSDGSHGSHNHNSKKRGHSGSDQSRSDRSRSHSRSRSSRTSSSRSTSRSPVSRKKVRSPSRKYKKERRLSPIRYTYKEKHSHKRKRRSRSRSQSRPHEEHYSKSSLKKYYKEKDRGYSPDRHRSRKHRNGHRASSRDRYDIYRR
ncbi:cyclin-L1-like isoform X1 [Haliotis rubra]|uniref:cyclin-L1-like isoform X1 n=1 Tax=Haliotis rubra TaxID=36100 RepID=UPI001EE5C69E|nr:cyclin-L1-like isoform X1 [Haliotis rubra]